MREEKQIKNPFKKHFQRYGWDGVYSDIKKQCEAMYGEYGGFLIGLCGISWLPMWNFLVTYDGFLIGLQVDFSMR